MKHTREQRLDIAKCVYDGELTVEEAAVKYGLKKGYSVKGSGVKKKRLPIDSGNIK